MGQISVEPWPGDKIRLYSRRGNDFTRKFARINHRRFQNLEGVIAKRLNSKYHPDGRSNEWLKLP
jgi:ATP-dependent DNA ligase